MRRNRGRVIDGTMEVVEDDLPKTGLFAEPLVARLDVLEPEALDQGEVRVTFRLEVQDAEGRRCPDLSVEARIAGPARDAMGAGHTDIMGRVKFRMAGPPGAYSCEIIDVAAGALQVPDLPTASVEA